MVNLIAAEAGEAAVATDYPYEIRILDDLRIPLSDGRNLSARMWIPVDAEAIPVPAVIEYAPFRHRDFSYPRDAVIHPWFAGHGYASIRLEPSGAMDSDGPPLDEYVLQEQDDCIEALAWIADQSWCTGATGMFGMSWGAFSALQVAARRPPSLRAIIPVHGTDDRFTDDVHYLGGCLSNVSLGWGALYQTYMVRPPFKECSTEEWLSAWKERASLAPDILSAWVGHQTRDEYWRHASICEDYGAIQAATFVICGWADGYTNAAVRMAEKLTCPNRALIGPWAHTYPHIALPGPQIGFLEEATNWWDRWLKDVQNGADQEARVTYYMQDGAPPAPSYAYRTGRWISETAWPSPHVQDRKLYLSGEVLGDARSTEEERSIRTPLTNAINGWEWLPHGVGPEMPLDQREEDAGSICFTTEPLSERVEICGRPLMRLRLKSDSPTGTICIRLSDVAPDGASSLITYQLRNLSLTDDFSEARTVPVNTWQDIEIRLNVIAQSVDQGHRLRLSVSTQSWPLTWPAPDMMTLTLQLNGCSVGLPLRDLGAPDGDVRALAPVRLPPSAEKSPMRDVVRSRIVEVNPQTAEIRRQYVKDDGRYVVSENNQVVDSWSALTYSIQEDVPLSARADLRYKLAMGDADYPAEIESEFSITADSAAFKILGKISATYQDKSVFETVIDTRVPRIAV